jgi:hypothetical protein
VLSGSAMSFPFRPGSGSWPRRARDTGRFWLAIGEHALAAAILCAFRPAGVLNLAQLLKDSMRLQVVRPGQPHRRIQCAGSTDGSDGRGPPVSDRHESKRRQTWAELARKQHRRPAPFTRLAETAGSATAASWRLQQWEAESPGRGRCCAGTTPHGPGLCHGSRIVMNEFSDAATAITRASRGIGRALALTGERRTRQVDLL